MPSFKPIRERIESLSVPEPNSGCWIWMGCVDKCGYGKMGARLNGRPHPETLAHRFSYMEYVGPIPAGTEIDHKCNVRCCVNPSHLRAISHAENVARFDHTKNHNSAKDRCKRGHPLSGANLGNGFNLGRPRRFCKKCCTDREALRARPGHSGNNSKRGLGVTLT